MQICSNHTFYSRLDPKFRGIQSEITKPVQQAVELVVEKSCAKIMPEKAQDGLFTIVVKVAASACSTALDGAIAYSKIAVGRPSGIMWGTTANIIIEGIKLLESKHPHIKDITEILLKNKG